MTERDPGLQPERTRLSWQRTTLTAVAALLVGLRLLVQVSPVVAIGSTLAAALALALPVWSVTRWQLAHRPLGSAPTDGRAPALLALVVGLCGLAALGYAIVR